MEYQGKYHVRAARGRCSCHWFLFKQLRMGQPRFQGGTFLGKPPGIELTSTNLWLLEVQVVKKREKTGREGGWKALGRRTLYWQSRTSSKDCIIKRSFVKKSLICLERMFFSLNDLVVKTVIGWGRVWYKNYAEQGGLFSPKAEGWGKWHLPDLKNSRDR